MEQASIGHGAKFSPLRWSELKPGGAGVPKAPADAPPGVKLLRVEATPRPWSPQAPTTAEQSRALEQLYDGLDRAWDAIKSLDAASREVLDLAYRSADFDGTDRRRPRYLLTEPGRLEDDQNALYRLEDDQNTLYRMFDRAAVALRLLPRAGGALPLHSLRWVVRELATIYTETTGRSFSVGHERGTIDALNEPAHWVARVVKIIDPDVTDANLRTTFR